MKKYRINQQIRAPRVRLVIEGEGLVEMSLEEALSKAHDSGLDLMEVDESSLPPVCKMMDYGKYLYKLQKEEQKAKKLSKQIEVKEVRIGFATGPHDLEVKEKQIRRFLEKLHKVRISLMLRGREMAHMDLALQRMIDFVNRLTDVATQEREPKKQANKVAILLSPINKKP